MSHTKGKLTYQENSDVYTHIIRDANGQYVASAPQGSNGIPEADARRLVACWNACDGLPQDALDGGWTAAGISQYAKGLETERDELLAALQKFVSESVTQDIGGADLVYATCEAREQAAATLAKYPKAES